MQIVYLSIRPDQLEATLKHVEWFMPFVREVLVCAPDALFPAFEAMSSALTVSLVGEGELFNREERAWLATTDHQRRNYSLRAKLMQRDLVQDECILCDDDARPLIPLTLEHFKKDGRYRSFYFYQLAHWPNKQTEFDSGQHDTFAVLNQYGLPTLSFASHMPQLVNKACWRAAVDFFDAHSPRFSLCEWTSYFNFSQYHHPELFGEPEPFKTLCWPEHPLAWPFDVTPEQFWFENVTPDLYEKDGPFAGLDSVTSADDQAAINIKKVAKWQAYSVLQRHPEQVAGWTKYLNYRVWRNKLAL